MPSAQALQSHIAAISARAGALDYDAAFPTEDFASLAKLGVTSAPLPRAQGGEGAGTEPDGVAAAFAILRSLGQGNLSVGRLFEAHVNAVRLVVRFGTDNQLREMAEACRTGLFYGLWVTDAPNNGLRLEAGVLKGAKGPCSGAGHLRRALVTVTDHGDVRMALLEVPAAAPVEELGPRLHGMRASTNGTIHLDGIPLPGTSLIGLPGDYLREPDFSTGAWRTMAVTLGGLEALVEAVRLQLRSRKYDTAPLQQARFGHLLIAKETARLWAWEAAQIAEAGLQPTADQVAAVNLARIAVESACLDAMRLAQQALGLSALLRPHVVERLLRDLTTYLRQPAPDAVLTEAAQHALRA